MPKESTWELLASRIKDIAVIKLIRKTNNIKLCLQAVSVALHPKQEPNLINISLSYLSQIKKE